MRFLPGRYPVAVCLMLMLFSATTSVADVNSELEELYAPYAEALYRGKGSAGRRPGFSL